MLTVRFPTGLTIQYNQAFYCVAESGGYFDLFTSEKKDDWVATVPNTCIIEAHAPCRVYNPLNGEIDIRNELRSIHRKLMGKKKR